ncbi:alpha/beta hydrolase [Natronoglomus mannanivorans]|uniref:Alpha/beta hydrolase n=1 Tax=Natronoglomus mannanivorans TaxID=2979990 RepID=A0AAP3E1E6_9EURY|nr:alpha/beta hydrolase [Halobacteria archaeon AArc-xg1-1]
MTDVLVPGGRDVRGTLEGPDDASSIVVACPPHPEHGGHRGDRRLVAVSDALADRGLACLRFDYGEWDEGEGEREDVRNAVRWAVEREWVDRVGVFGYSFGASEAILASASLAGRDEGSGSLLSADAVAALAPTARLGARSDLDVVTALAELSCPVAIHYGTRDTTAEWEPVVERARKLRDRDTDSPDRIDLVDHSSDHFFVGQHVTIAEEIGSFFAHVLE